MATALASGSCCSFLRKKSSFCIEEINGRNYDTRIPISISCQSRESVNHHFNPKIKKFVQERVFLQQILQSVQKMGKGIKDSLSPKQKGDWKDLTLMSLSFAVYVYISQKLVCAYCAWISILDQAM